MPTSTRPSRRLSTTLLVLGVVLSFSSAVCFLLLDLPGAGTALFTGVVVVAAVGFVAERADERRRAAWFAARHGSVAAVAAGLDVDAVRRCRDQQGEVSAVVAVRRQQPDLTLLQAVELVRSL
ncbi:MULTISPECIES: hypothetical protein [unclassified Actinotalea]|uniref:hypothetical protein n=1 Tax=unclassified Actinotalea TaxID=2638618 RepID=UPI0015F48903|nr:MULTISPECIES: hypothetical protein [unclassified Actinotalea]